jgi:cysteine-rich repeat protein
MSKRALVVSIVALAVLVTGMAAAGPTPAQKCAVAKQKAASKKETGKLGCYAKAKQKSLPVDGECLMKIEANFSKAFEKADPKGPCVGNEQDVESAVDNCITKIVDDTEGAVPGNGKCQALMVKAAGKKAAARINCYAKATIKNLPVDNICLGKATDKFTAAAAKANDPVSGGPCANANAVESVVDNNCVLAVVGGLKGVAPNVCGNGIIETYGTTTETCDDGNTVNGDACPANCVIKSCTVGTTSNRTATVSFTPPAGHQLTSITVLLDYPEGKVSLPGSGGPPQNSTIEGRLSLFPSGTGHTSNDQDYELKEIVTASDGQTPFNGPTLFRATFDSCQGATAPVASDYSCTVTNATDENLMTITGATCSVSIP